MKVLLQLVLVFFLIAACKREASEDYPLFQLSTGSDSAVHHYNEGWRQIMDYGNYSRAEEEWRKARSHDKDFLLNLSVLARITQDLDERLALIDILEERKTRLSGDERKVLDVYMALAYYINFRDQKSYVSDSALNSAVDLSFENLKGVVHRNPERVYLKAEYFEVLHRKIGAEQTLDSIQALTLPTQLDNPFILGYRASLYAETGNFDAALLVARRLVNAIDDLTVVKPYAVLADIYYQQGDYARATINVDRAYSIDPNNLDILGIRGKLNELN